MPGAVVEQHAMRMPQSSVAWASFGVTTSCPQPQPQHLQQCFQPAHCVNLPEAVWMRQSDPVHSSVEAPNYNTQCNHKHLFRLRPFDTSTTTVHNQNNIMQYEFRPLGTGHDVRARDFQFDDVHENGNELSSLPQVQYASDDGRKPPYSYAQLAAMAIWQAPNRRLTVAGIYDWISNTFQFYREGSQRGWQNSIRHNLSLHTAFSKEERRAGEVGKGCWWVIRPGMAALVLPKKAVRTESCIAQGERKPLQAGSVSRCAGRTICEHSWQRGSVTDSRKVRRLSTRQLSPNGPLTADNSPESHSDTNKTSFGTALRRGVSPLHQSSPDSLPISVSSSASAPLAPADARFWPETAQIREGGISIEKKRIRSPSSLATSDQTQLVSPQYKLYRNYMTMGRILKSSSPARKAFYEDHDTPANSSRFGCQEFKRPGTGGLFDFRHPLTPPRHSSMSTSISHKHGLSISNAVNAVLSDSTTRANCQSDPEIQCRVPVHKSSWIVAFKTATSLPKNLTTVKRIQGVGKENRIAVLSPDYVTAMAS